MKKIIKSAMAVALLLLAVSCQEYDFGYNPDTPDRASTEYSRRFANRDDVNVNIVTQTPGAPYFVYFDNPYDADGNYNGSTAYLQGRTPLNTTLSVPRHVDSLYIISPMREMVVMPVGDVNINEPDLFEDPVVTRVNIDEPPYPLGNANGAAFWTTSDADLIQTYKDNPHINNDVMNYLNACLPSGSEKGNVTGDDLTKNSDLTLPATDENEYVAVWITYLGKGTNDPDYKIWFYVYQPTVDASGNEIIDEPLLYGRDSDGKISYIAWNQGTPHLENPLFDSTDKNLKIGSSIFVGYVKAGYQLGLCYQAHGNGQAAKSRFTTPALNAKTVGGDKQKLCGGVIINKEIEVKVNKDVSELHEFNFIGFERQTPKTNGNNSQSDNDFNDALVCIETNPAMKPKEDIPVDPILNGKITYEGYYLFEDLYDKEHTGANDNDFNDVVVYYKTTIYNLGTEESPNWKCDFGVELLANACVNTNTIGVYHKSAEDDYRCFPLINGISGIYNMENVPIFTGENKQQITFNMESEDDVILPYLRTVRVGETMTAEPDGGTSEVNNNVYTTTYGTEKYPFVIEIPYTDSPFFQWSMEGVPIDETYPNWNTTVDWYTDTPKTGCYVPRTSGGLY